MRGYRTLPLGVDIGTARARIALAEHNGTDVRLKAVASRDVAPTVAENPQLVAALLDEMLAELGVRDRRCITALGGSDCVLRVVRFPKMSWQERVRAARYEAQRFAASLGDEESLVRIHRGRERGSYAIGVTRKERLTERTATLRLAKLRPVAVDHDAFALRRAFPVHDAIVDIGCDRSTLHLYTPHAPFSHHAPVGGAEVTLGIARELSIDAGTAERRKRILGSAGTGSAIRDSLVAELSILVERARARAPVNRIALVGNGARLPGLAGELEGATGAIVELTVPRLLETTAYPEDVLRAAAPDWALAAALTTWRIVA